MNFPQSRIVLLLVALLPLGAITAQQQVAVVSDESGNKVFLRIDPLLLRGDLDTLYASFGDLQDQIDNLSWADVLENGTSPGIDVNFFGFDATGLGQVTTTGTLTGDSLVLNKDAAITGRLNVSGVTTLNDSLMVQGTVVLNDSLRVVKATSLGSRLHVTGVTALGDSLHVVGNVDLDALFHVDGAATFGSTVTVTGETTLMDTLQAQSAALLDDSLRVGGNTHLQQDLQVDGSTNIGGSLSVTGPTSLSGTLNVTGVTSLGDSLQVTGASDFAGNLNVDGNTTLNAVRMDGDLELNGNANISDSLVVVGAADFSSTVDVAGATTLNASLDVNGVTSLNDSLHVSGGVDIDSNLNVDGHTTLNTSTLNGATTVAGMSTFSDEVNFNDTIHANAPAMFSDSVMMTGGASVGGTLSVSELIIDGVTIPALDNTDALPEGDSNLYFTADREAALQDQIDAAAEREAAMQNQIDAADSVNQVLTTTLSNLLNQLFDPATVTTGSATSVSAFTANLNATYDDGGAEVDDAGFMLSSNSDLSDSTEYSTTISGSLAEAVASLSKGTTYYYRGYVETLMGRAVGDTQSFTTIGDAVVGSSSSSNVTKTDATLSSSITSAGGGTVSQAGFQYGTTTSWSSASTVTSSSTSGSFSKSITGLAEGTTYYFRPFVTNEAGTAYGSSQSFTTDSGPCTVESVAYEGFTYNTVEIGDQCWFQERLQNTNFRNGDPIAQGPGDYSNPGPVYYVFNDETHGDIHYYNFFAIDDARGLCPSGWHVPSLSEFETMGSLYSTEADWSDAAFLAPIGSNSSGFSLLPNQGWVRDGKGFASTEVENTIATYIATTSQPTSVPFGSPEDFFVSMNFRDGAMDTWNTTSIDDKGVGVRCLMDD